MAAGADQMSGGLGNDFFMVDNIGDSVTEEEDEGTDTVSSTVSLILGAHIENLTLTGSGVNATGNDLDNVLTGNAGINTLTGGEGNDTYIIQNLQDVIIETSLINLDSVQSTVTHTLANSVENLTLLGTASISANGNNLSNLLIGNSGANTLNGGGGADRMAGGLGNDTYMVDNIGDMITESANGGLDKVTSSVNYILAENVENLTLTGSDPSVGIGNSLNNLLVGSNVTNWLDGMAGRDTMQGMDGNDIYFVNNVGDVVIEAANKGNDWVQSTVSYTFPINVENLFLVAVQAICKELVTL